MTDERINILRADVPVHTVLYTDVLCAGTEQGHQVGRDDMWAVSTESLNRLRDIALRLQQGKDKWIELYQAEQDKREEAEKQRDALRAAAIKATGSPHLLCVHPAKVKGCDCLGVMFAKALCDVGRSDEEA